MRSSYWNLFCFKEVYIGFLNGKRAKENDYAHLPYTQLRIFLFFKRLNLFLIATGIAVFFIN